MIFAGTPATIAYGGTSFDSNGFLKLVVIFQVCLRHTPISDIC